MASGSTRASSDSPTIAGQLLEQSEGKHSRGGDQGASQLMMSGGRHPRLHIHIIIHIHTHARTLLLLLLFLLGRLASLLALAMAMAMPLLLPAST